MSKQQRTNWDAYTRSWKVETVDEKRALLSQCMAAQGVYRDPLMETQTRDDLIAYMLDFHRQIPGGHFVIKHYQAHHNRSIAEWEMRNGENALVGTGISFAEYDPTGKLTSVSGFFEVPEEVIQ